MKRFTTVDQFLAAEKNWPEELVRLREILSSIMKLTETVKWGSPVYTYKEKLVVGIGGFKSYFGLWFYEGTHLTDPNSVLINAQEGKTKAMRQWRMTSAKEIKPTVIKAYIKEAIGLVDAGVQTKADRSKPIVVPAELKSALARNSKAKECFSNLTIGKRREFTEYISDAKRAETKQTRIEKILPMIIEGVGLNDKYKNC